MPGIGVASLSASVRRRFPRQGDAMTTTAIERTTATETSARQRRLIFGALLLVLFIASLDQTIVSTALPTIVGDLGGLEHLSWVVTSYLLASTVVGPLYGKLGDLYGRKRVLQFALVLFLVGSALVRAGAEHAAADRLQSRPGARRRRPDRRGDGRRRRPRRAARPRPLPGPVRRRVRRRRSSPVRCSAASSSTTSRGAGSSTSTCRSALSRWR